MSTPLDSMAMSCACGQVGFEVRGAPILVVTCHCGSCRQAGATFAAMPGAARVFDDEGGTPFIMARKDRITCVRGEGLLRAYRLTPTSPTRRVLTSCCQSPMFLEFENGHWLSMYRNRFDASAPPSTMRVMVGDLAGRTLSPPRAYRTHSVSFMWRLLKAWAAMGFRVPPPLPAAPFSAPVDAPAAHM